MVQYHVGVAVQPGLAMIVGHGMGVNIKPEVMARFAPLRSLIAAGVHVSGGSDGPIINPDWKQGIQSAVSRRAGKGVQSGFLRAPAEDKALGPDQAIALKDAIRMYTIEAAWLDHKEKVKGSIEVGKVADFCILDEDILTIETQKIRDIPTLMTLVGGKIVYNAKPDTLLIQ
jgi:hypothetical protein